MSEHEQYADDLSLCAMGALEGSERQLLEEHLQQCSACRQELETLRGDAALLALSVSGPKPPARSRERLMAAIKKEPRRIEPAPPARKSWWRPVEWALAAAVVIVIFLLVRQNGDLRQTVSSLEATVAGQQQESIQAQRLVASLASPDSEHFTLVASNTPPQPQGKAIYSRKTGTLVFLANNMPKLAPQKTYELWLIPQSGAPIAAGLFKPDARGSATVIEPPLPAGVQAKTFAITVEPEQGSSAPTSQPIMIGIQS
ncbi:MAG: anti-sigma factor [Candidatus Sulfotelmatobacter sp.]